MRIAKPKVLGWISVLYALLVHAWQPMVPLISLAALVALREAARFDVSRFLLDLLPLVYFLLYFLGGIGLIMLRRRAALLVLLAAAVELIYNISIYDISDRLDSVAELSVKAALRSLSPFIVPIVIAFASWWLWLRRQALFVPSSDTCSPPESVAEAAGPSDEHYFRYMLLAILLFGMVIPVSTGIVVKLYLESLGVPTLPWSYFVNVSSLFLLIPFSVWWSVPYLVLVYAARNLRTRPLWGLKTYRSRLICVSSGFIGGTLGSIGLFVSVFASFDPVFLFAPIWFYYLPHLAAGLLVGYMVAKRTEAYSEKRVASK